MEHPPEAQSQSSCKDGGMLSEEREEGGEEGGWEKVGEGGGQGGEDDAT